VTEMATRVGKDVARTTMITTIMFKRIPGTAFDLARRSSTLVNLVCN
jgi:hypothetical protein